MKFIFALFSTFLFSFAVSPSFAMDRTIAVSGEAAVKVVPDEIDINLGVETWDPILAKAKEANDAVIKKLIPFLKKKVEKPEHVGTDMFTVEQTYDYPSSSGGVKRITGYNVRSQLQVLLKDTKVYEDVINEVVKIGTTGIQSVQFRTSKLRVHRDEARKLALKAAREKAILMAETLGAKVGEVVNINEGYGGYYYSGWRGNRSGYGGMQTQNVVQNASGGGGESMGETGALGQVSVNASVNVTFQLR